MQLIIRDLIYRSPLNVLLNRRAAGISSSIMTAVILFIQYWDFNGKIIRIVFYGNILIAYQEVTG